MLGDLSLMPTLLIAFSVAFAVAMPAWTPLSRRFGKREVFVIAGLVQASGCLVFFFATPIPITIACAALVGAADGGLSTLGASLGADVTARSAARSGQHKEGVYFAVWSFGGKLAVGAAILLVGLVLDAGGFVPGAAQDAQAQLAIRTLLGAVPASLVFASTALMLRYPPEPGRAPTSAAAGRPPHSALGSRSPG